MSNVRKVLADALGLPETSTDDELANGLANVLAPKFEQAPTGSKKFVDIVADYLASDDKLTYGDAASKASLLHPESYSLHVKEASLN